jgi:translation initiation factor IF-3
VISAGGDQLGIMSTDDAIRIAQEQGLDLVEVAAQSRPPVCRIMDYGKFKYAQKKKSQGTKKHAAGQTVKEVKLRPKTEDHDYQFKLKHILRFLMDGAKVKVTIRFRGRELVHKDIGLEMLERITKDVTEMGVVSSPAFMEGKLLQMVLTPSPKALVIKRNRDEERERAKEAERAERRKAGLRDEPKPLEQIEDQLEDEEAKEEIGDSQEIEENEDDKESSDAQAENK